MNIYIVDIRNEDELSERYIVTANEKYYIINIPLRHLGFNYNYLEYLSRNNLIYLVCRSGNRSSLAKIEFFSNIDNIKSLNGGLNGISIFNGDLAIISDKGAYSPQTYTKFIIIAIISFILITNNIEVNVNYINLVLVSILIFVIYQLINKSCILETIVPLFKPQV